MKKFEEKYVWFVRTKPTLANYGFGSYSDKKTGEVKYISYSKNVNGTDKMEYFKFTPREGSIKIPAGKKDINGNLVVEFLRQAPACAGSENGTYVKDENGQEVQVGIFYKELNDSADAKHGISLRKKRIEAEDIAMNLEGEEVRELAAILGSFTSDSDVMKFKLLDFAGSQPDQFLQMYNDPSRKVKALVKIALDRGVFSKKGTVIYWDTEMIGTDESEAVRWLLQNEDAMFAIKQKLTQGEPIASEEIKKKPGRPKKNETT